MFPIKMPPWIAVGLTDIMAKALGLEPRLTVLETAVLPITPHQHGRDGLIRTVGYQSQILGP